MGADHRKGAGALWEDGTWEGARRWQMTAAMSATPEQRLDWLEEMIEIAHSSGAARRRLEQTAPASPLPGESQRGEDHKG